MKMNSQLGHNGGPPLVELEYTDPQFELIATDKRYPAMVAGFGSGKTEALVSRALRLKFEFPDNNIAYYLPTYDLVTTIAFPRFEEKLAELGLVEGEDFKTVKSQTPKIKIFGAGEIIFRTLDRPSRIVGYEVGDSLVDELDTLKEKDAELAWQKIISRNRQKKFKDGVAVPNTVAVGTTPEGFRFVYKRWKKEPPSDEYHIIRASTYSNARNLPEDYIQDLINDYPSNLIAAYLDGEFVNLTSGSVYPDFDRTLSNCETTIIPGESLHIGMDFNVGKMAGVVWVRRGNDPHAAEEINNVFDTPAMIEVIKRRFPNHPIYIYPDASGGARKTNNASQSDISLLQQAGFTVLNNPTNPLVKDRVLSMNVMIHSAAGLRRLKVNCNNCPAFAEALEKQAYNDKGEPDKTGGFDHIVDAGGYFIAFAFPVIKRTVSKVKIGGI